MKYLVAIDGSDNAKAAFYTTISLMKNHEDNSEDLLYLLTIVDDATSYAVAALGEEAVDSVISPYEALQESLQKKGEDLLRAYSKICQYRNIPFSLIVGISNHPGSLICDVIHQKQVQLAIVGRRGMSSIKRFFVGSTSSYVMENADCNCMVVKGSWGPPESHSSIEEINKVEEQERKDRIQHEEELKNIAHQVEKIFGEEYLKRRQKLSQK